MKNIFSLSISRVFVFLLCFILLFTLVGKPITAQAAATTFVEIATNYQDIAQVAPYLLPFILIVIGLDYYYTNIDDIIAKATALRNSCSSSVHKWAESVADQIMAGSVVVSLPTTVRNEINLHTNSGHQLDSDDQYIGIPSSLLGLGALTSAEILLQSSAGLLQENNTISRKANALLTDLKANVLLLPSLIAASLTSSFTDVKNALGSKADSLYNLVNLNFKYVLSGIEALPSVFNQQLNMLRSGVESLSSATTQHLNMVISGIQTLPTVFNNQLNMLRSGVETLSSATTQHLNMVISGIEALPSVFNQQLNMLRAGVESLNSATTQHLNMVISGIQSHFGTLSTTFTNSFANLETLVKQLLASGTTTTPPNFNNSMNQSNDEENKLITNAGIGGDKTIYFIGKGKDLLSKYRIAFLAVGAILVKFFDIPVLSELITFSLALGIFALIVNLANTLVSKDRQSDARFKKFSTAKGG